MFSFFRDKWLTWFIIQQSLRRFMFLLTYPLVLFVLAVHCNRRIQMCVQKACFIYLYLFDPTKRSWIFFFDRKIISIYFVKWKVKRRSSLVPVSQIIIIIIIIYRIIISICCSVIHHYSSITSLLPHHLGRWEFGMDNKKTKKLSRLIIIICSLKMKDWCLADGSASDKKAKLWLEK